MRTSRKRNLCRVSRGVLLLAFGLCGSTYAQGQNADALYVDLSRCVGLDSDAARFACYQERVDAALAEQDATAPAVTEEPARAPSPIPAPARRRAPESVAADDETSNDASSVEAVSDRADESDNDEIFGTIAALRETVPDTWIITLDNGQVWQMTRSQRYPLRVGQEVRLYGTRWGDSYRLTLTERGGYVPVRRAN